MRQERYYLNIMKWRVRPSKLSGTIAIPPSKSHTIRALLIATLADGVSVIRRPLLRGDGASAIGAARSLGAEIDFQGDVLTVKGTGSDFNRGQEFFDMGNSGTSTNLFASAAALGTKKRRLDGDNSLRSRPFKPVLEALKGLGVNYTLEAPPRDLPFTIQGPIKGGTTSVDGISSQFVSSLLLTCPLIKSGDTTFTVYNLHEQPYIELTLWWLKKQNIRFDCSDDYLRFHIPGNQAYTPFDMEVPGDFSSATFAATGAAICGSEVTLTGIDFSDPQGDKGVFEIIKKAGGLVKIAQNSASVNGGGPLTGTSIDLNAMPDALPALSVLACASRGSTAIVNVAQARIKETDRIKVMAEELSKMGASITERPDGLIIGQSRLRGAVVNGHDDHRVVMALALAGMIAEGETIIETAEAAEVTYPTFVEDFKAIGADITII
jgi:3-phosphoshikimate 1-carboxyvinyltransferase